jgi:integrase
MRLTDMTIQTAQPPDTGRLTIWDDSSPLGVRITSKGAKTFIMILHRKRHAIGRYGDITLSQARTAAKQLKAEQTLGRLIPSSRTLADARDEYLKGINIRASTRRYYERNLHRLADCRLTDVRPADLNRVLDALPPPARIQALKTYVAFFNWCIRRHYLDTSPCIRFRADKPTSRTRVLNNDEIKAIWNASEQLGDFGRIIRLCLLTGQRRGELSNPSSVMIRQSTLTIPASLTKNKKEHSIPISATSIELFQNLKKPVPNRDDPKQKLDALSGVTNWVVHDCRRTVASNMAALGVRIEVIEKILNHTGQLKGVAGVYNRHTYEQEMREAFQVWEAHLMTTILKCCTVEN